LRQRRRSAARLLGSLASRRCRTSFHPLPRPFAHSSDHLLGRSLDHSMTRLTAPASSRRHRRAVQPLPEELMPRLSLQALPSHGRRPSGPTTPRAAPRRTAGYKQWKTKGKLLSGKVGAPEPYPPPTHSLVLPWPKNNPAPAARLAAETGLI